MRDYGKVHTSFWTSETIRSMSEDARNLAMYLLTCPHNTIAGVFRLPDGYVCDDLQWTPERVSKAFEETVSKGFADRCATTKWVWINKHFEWNPPENPNQRKSAAKIVESIPDKCIWKPAFMRDCAESIGVKSEPLDNPSETLPQSGTGAGTGAGTGVLSSPSASTKQNGTRLPENWVLPKAWGEWALSERPDLQASDVRRIADAFKDHWLANANQAKAKKADWMAAWRNWIRGQKAVVQPKQEQIAKHNEQVAAEFLGSATVVDGEVANA